MADPLGRPVSSFYYGNLKGSHRRFSMHFAELEIALRNYAQTGDTREIRTKARTITKDELRKLGRQVLEPVFRSRAPERDWGNNPKAPRHKLLKETIKATVTGSESDEPEVRIDMGQWGELTITGRGGLHSSKVMMLVLPGGQVIFRRHVGSRTTRAYSSGALAPWDGQRSGADRSKSRGLRNSFGQGPFKGTFPEINPGRAQQRMKWAEYAWEDVKNSGAIEQISKNVVLRMLDSSFLKDLVNVDLEGYVDDSEMDKFSRDLEGLRSGGSFNHPYSPYDRRRVTEKKRRLRLRKKQNVTVHSEKHKPLVKGHIAKELRGEFEQELEYLHEDIRDYERDLKEALHSPFSGKRQRRESLRLQIRQARSKLADIRNRLKH